MKQTQTVPSVLDPAAHVVNLLPETARQDLLTPETPVLAVNRSPRALKDKFDGQDYVIPGHCQFMAPYAAAKHFQDRLIVPGTRTLDANGTQSYIGILGPLGGKRVDDEARCTLFDEHDQALLDRKVEGIDREALDDPKARKVEVQAVRQNISRGAAAVRAGTTIEANDGGAIDPNEVLTPSGNQAAEELRAAQGEGWRPQGGGAVDLNVTMPPAGQAPRPAGPSMAAARKKLRQG
jgi:hypothetical protein